MMDEKKDYFVYTDKMTVGYNGEPLIRDIEIRLKKGEILTLIGPNGAGKSTILKYYQTTDADCRNCVY